MAFCRVLVPFLVIIVAQCYATVEVPVFLWGDLYSETGHSALTPVSFRDFGVILKHNFEDDPFTVVFAEETLSAEDFSTKTDGDSSYPYLESKVDSALYLRSVESPLRVLHKFTISEKVQHLTLTEDGLSGELNPEQGKIVIINLKDAREDESRADMLKRHNDFMKEEMVKVQEQGGDLKIIGIYTAHYPSWTITEHSRMRRQAMSENSTSGSKTDLSFNGFRIYFEAVRLLVNGTNEMVFTTGMVGESVVNGSEVHSTIEFPSDTKITLNYNSKAGYWHLESANIVNSGVEEELKLIEPVFAILGFSYRCSSNVTFVSINETTSFRLTIQNSRMQPFFTSNETAFGDMFNCIGFFTVPIWAGLFVVSILLTIMFYGIMMMMDIRTMDRFDDPKGKTITINAGE